MSVWRSTGACARAHAWRSLSWLSECSCRHFGRYLPDAFLSPRLVVDDDCVLLAARRQWLWEQREGLFARRRDSDRRGAGHGRIRDRRNPGNGRKRRRWLGRGWHGRRGRERGRGEPGRHERGGRGERRRHERRGRPERGRRDGGRRNVEPRWGDRHRRELRRRGRGHWANHRGRRHGRRDGRRGTVLHGHAEHVVLFFIAGERLPLRSGLRVSDERPLHGLYSALWHQLDEHDLCRGRRLLLGCQCELLGNRPCMYQPGVIRRVCCAARLRLDRAKGIVLRRRPHTLQCLR